MGARSLTRSRQVRAMLATSPSSITSGQLCRATRAASSSTSLVAKKPPPTTPRGLRPCGLLRSRRRATGGCPRH
eukprot:7684710-Pyramimonas_sp.AAC.1